MRNKKYRGWKAILILLAIGIVSVLLGVILFDGIARIITIVGGAILISMTIMAYPQYFEIQSDRIIARGANSTSMQYYRSFKKQVFMFDDIKDIYVEGKKYIWINLKNGAIINLPIGGRFHRNEIIELIYEVRAQIKGYEQQYVQTND